MNRTQSHPPRGLVTSGSGSPTVPMGTSHPSMGRGRDAGMTPSGRLSRSSTKMMSRRSWVSGSSRKAIDGSSNSTLHTAACSEHRTCAASTRHSTFALIGLGHRPATINSVGRRGGSACSPLPKTATRYAVAGRSSGVSGRQPNTSASPGSSVSIPAWRSIGVTRVGPYRDGTTTRPEGSGGVLASGSVGVVVAGDSSGTVVSRRGSGTAVSSCLSSVSDNAVALFPPAVT